MSPQLARRRTPRPSVEPLESRVVPSTIIWENRGTASDTFSAAERAIIDVALDVWENRVVDLNNGSNTYGITFLRQQFPPGQLGEGGPRFTSNFQLLGGDVLLDDNGGGFGWYLDPNPLDSAEFPNVVSPFYRTGGPNGVDFFTTVLHEIGHAIGYLNVGGPWAARLTPSGGNLVFNGANGVQAVLDGSGNHLVEAVHPDDLMKSVQLTGERYSISDLDLAMLAEVWGYQVNPSTGGGGGGAAVIQFISGAAAVNEGGAVELVVTRSGDISTEVSATIFSQDGSATVGVDYGDGGAVGGIVTFPPGVTEQTLTIVTLADNAAEPGETFVVGLASPSDGAALGIPASTTVTILDGGGNGGGGTTSGLAFNPAQIRLLESAGVALFTLTRDDASTVASIELTLIEDGNETILANPVMGEGVAALDISIPFDDNDLVEGRRTLILRAEADDFTGAPLQVATTTLTLLDDDDTANVRFVATSYLDLLRRPADSDALDFWSNLIEDGLDRTAFALILMGTDEYRINSIITPAYEGLLGRTPDGAGLQYWLGALAQGVTGEQLEAVLLGSDEYFARVGGSNAAFLGGLYSDLFRRAADAGGQAFWLGQLNAGLSRTTVAALFAASAEHRTLEVQERYLATVGRPASSGDAAFWVSTFDLGLTADVLSALLVSSQEYLSFQTDLV